MTALMLVPHTRDGLWSNVSAVRPVRGEKKIMSGVAQIAAQPATQGDREALLGPVHVEAGKPWGQVALEEELGDRPAILELGRQPGRELDDLVVEQRRAYLERRGHAHPVNFHEDVVVKPRLEVHIKDLGQRIGVPDALEVTRESLEGVVVPRLLEKLRRAEGLLLIVA